MTLEEAIIADLTTAMKARDELIVRTLRMLKADIMKYKVSGADKIATDEVVTDLIKKAVKQRKDAAEAFEKGGNSTAAQGERDEIGVLEKYLPAQLSEEEVKKAVSETIQQMSAAPSDFGKVMGAVMAKLKNQADGAVVSKAVKELLG